MTNQMSLTHIKVMEVGKKTSIKAHINWCGKWNGELGTPSAAIPVAV